MAKYKLGEICEIVGGSTPKSDVAEYWDGDIKWITPAELNEDSYILTDSVRKITALGVQKAGLSPFPKDTVILSSRAPIGKVAIAGCEMYCNQGFKNLICSSVIDCHYLYWFLKGKTEYLNSLGRGATFKEISKQIVAGIEIEVPPIEKQQDIARRFEETKRIISILKQQIQVLDQLIKARFVEMSKNSITTPTRMGDVATYINGYAFKPTDWTTEGLPIIRIQNLNDREALYNHYSGAIDSKYQVHTGDILVSWATHLEAYLWQGGDAWLNQHIFRVIFDKMQINKIYYIYSTEDALRQAFKNAHGFKPTMEHIKRSDFEDAIILLPPIEVQNQFATFVTEVDKSKVVVQKALDEAKLLFESLMQKYFG